MNAAVKSYNIGGLTIPVVTTEACARVDQYMRRVPVTCACSRCAVKNAGMTQQQIYARMDAAHGVRS